MASARDDGGVVLAPRPEADRHLPSVWSFWREVWVRSVSRPDQCGRPIVANVRPGDLQREGPEYGCCEGHIPWGRGKVGVPARVVRTTNIASGCVAPKSVAVVR